MQQVAYIEWNEWKKEKIEEGLNRSTIDIDIDITSHLSVIRIA